MSFILDALKKSESDRQRQSGPALFEVKVAPPKARFPVWAIAIVALLAVNMVIVGWMLLRRSSHSDETANNRPAAASPGPPVAAVNGAQFNGAPANGAPFNPAQANVAQPNGNGQPGATNWNSNPAAQGQFAPPANQQGMAGNESRLPQRDQNEPTLANNGRDPYSSRDGGNARDAGGGGSFGNARNANGGGFGNGREAGNGGNMGNGRGGGTGREPDASDATNTGAAMNQREAGAPAPDASANPDDYAPATDPASSLFKGHVRRGTESGLALYQDAALVAGSNLPQLRLDLHVYAAKPQDRFALINMHKLHEGDSLQGGVRVEAITPDGVVMSHNGSKFLLPRD